MFKIPWQNNITTKKFLVTFFIFLGLYALIPKDVPVSATPITNASALESAISDSFNLFFKTYPFLLALLLYLDKKIGWIAGFGLLSLFVIALPLTILGSFNFTSVISLICIVTAVRVMLLEDVRLRYGIATIKAAVAWGILGTLLTLFLTTLPILFVILSDFGGSPS